MIRFIEAKKVMEINLKMKLSRTADGAKTIKAINNIQKVVNNY